MGEAPGVESQDRTSGVTILADHNLEGQAVLLWGTLASQGWIDLLPLRLVTLQEVGLPTHSTDRRIWRFAQERQMILLTANRSMQGADPVERTLREENTPTSLPVITIGGVERLEERAYREDCAIRLVEVVLGVDQFRGAGRIYIP